MPTPRANVPAPVSEQPAALTIPDDVREDLLRAQMRQVTTTQRLPSVRMMPAAALLYEFTDTMDTVREFQGVILNSHPRNVLWDKPYGEQTPGVEKEGPACGSSDGRYATPRPGFKHLALPGNLGRAERNEELVPATGAEQISCVTCPYNKWGSKGLVDPRGGKGKACTNQKSVYVLVEGRELPVELVLPPTSLQVFDRYLSDLSNFGVLVQSVSTVFKQERASSGSLQWAVLKLERGSTLSQESFDTVLIKRRRYLVQINPPGSVEPAPEVESNGREPGAEDAEVIEEPGGGDMPQEIPF